MEDFQALKNCRLFEGIAESDLESLLTCLSGRRRTHEKGAFILSEGDKARHVGIVLSGRVHVIKEDFWGNRTILSEVAASGIFAEAMAFAEEGKMAVSVVAPERTRVLLIDCKRIITSCPSDCVFHSSLIKNMLKVMARKNLALVGKIEHVTKRTTREKLLSYLSEQAKLNGSDNFTIPFNRQELADYLAVERSAMSAELSRMSRANLLTYHKNSFELSPRPA